MLTLRHGPRGFTLIELVIAIVILALLVALGTPVYQTWIANTQIRTMAESIQNGLRLAQAEAAKRNTQVDFILLSNSNFASNPTNASPTPSATGQSWIVRVTAPATFVEGKSGKEGSPNATLSVVTTPDPCTPAFGGTISFNGIGRLVVGCSVQIDINNTQGGNRPLRILLSVGGGVRMCDPSVTTAGDTRACS